MKNAFRWLFGFCPCCGRWFQYSTKRRRLSAIYADKQARYSICCKECFDDLERHYQDRWEKVHKGQRVKAKMI